jgi:hypothetical protein
MYKDITILCSTWRRCTLLWDQWCAIQGSLNRRAELEGLVRWAKRKHLLGPLRFYRLRLQDEEVRIAQFALQHRRMSIASHTMHYIASFLNPAQIHQKGSAAKFRMRKESLI